MPRKNQATKTVIPLRDPGGLRRILALRIQKRNSLDSIAGAITYALEFTDSAERTELPPLDYQSLDIVNLRTLIVHGYDHTTRGAALAALEQRMKEATQS